ncbi:serine esterase family protein [Artemisia annua]|uniref:Serine esterase family protein n=1 Tax=Artemisia annua TaxID=35608 RepID=A0A2U1LRK6_ARTAN|nr:serine esterase family protein [Artemisia annua]
MVEAVHEVAVYIHRFHNLDLFEQGWYQIKISMRWEDTNCTSSPGSPSRVIQYEDSELGCDDVFGAWTIDDLDNSFLSQPFRIRYARQDIFLCVMIFFNLSLGKNQVFFYLSSFSFTLVLVTQLIRSKNLQGPITSPVILKFELLFASILEARSSVQAFWDSGPAAVHEFRIPPKALLGLHSYCPIYFDSFHSVLVDTTVHIGLLKGGACFIKTPSDPHGHEETVDEKYNKANQVMFVKAFSASHAILLEELKNLSTTINQTIDLTSLISNNSEPANVEPSQVSDKILNDPEDPVSNIGYQSDYLYSLENADLSRLLYLLGDQILYLWKTYLKFHRNHKTRVLKQLDDAWANDRRAEWSIWIVFSKVDVLHQNIGSQVDDSNNGVLGKSSAIPKITEDPSETAAMRAELHRSSIAHMKMNSRSIQDLQIFKDPLRIPIIIIERVVNTPLPPTTRISYLESTDIKNNQQKSRGLRMAVFVHGFQGHHLDLRLVRNQWLLIDPKLECLMSRVNEDNTTGDFREMGLRLAQEVVSFVKRKMDKASRSDGLKNIKLSFVGHSIGNVIIRTALAESIMEPYHRFLNTYVSLSGPHLGYLYSSNSLFNSGLWLLKTIMNTRCIHQLTFTDDMDLEKTFLYKLCKQKTLECFKNIILLSSPQDGYVPYHSARIEMCQASSHDYSKKGQVFLEMLNNCLKQIHSPSSEQRMFMRCDVNFDVTLLGRNLNTLIGRAAHITFLESDTFVKFIMWSFPEFFC